MIKMFIVNGKRYTAKEFDFNLLCDLEEQGLSLSDMDKKPMSLIRTYLAFCGDITKQEAGVELEKHFINGGKVDEITEIMSSMMNESGFFRAMGETIEEEDTETSVQNQKRGRKAQATTEA